MSERRDPEKLQQAPAQPTASFRFEEFADAASAQAAFAAAYPVGSPIEPALQALSAMGAQGRTLNPTTVACRYLEKHIALVHRCWYINLACDRDKAIQRVSVAVGIVAV